MAGTRVYLVLGAYGTTISPSSKLEPHIEFQVRRVIADSDMAAQIAIENQPPHYYTNSDGNTVEVFLIKVLAVDEDETDEDEDVMAGRIDILGAIVGVDEFLEMLNGEDEDV